jgi:hypothetical protein
VRNLDLTVKVLEGSGDLFWGMAQLSKIDGCEVHGPAWPDMETGILGTDGRTYRVSPRDFGEAAFGNRWQIFCARIPTGVQLELVIAAVNRNDPLAPRKLMILGSYDVASHAETVKIARVVNVAH